VAQSPPPLTAAMCGGNAAAVRTALDAVLESLGTARQALDGPDPIGALLPWLSPGARARSAWPPVPSEPVELPAAPDVLLRLGRAGGWVVSVSPDLRTAARPVAPEV
jgi:prephenate dehydrogenase